MHTGAFGHSLLALIDTTSTMVDHTAATDDATWKRWMTTRRPEVHGRGQVGKVYDISDGKTENVRRFPYS